MPLRATSAAARPSSPWSVLNRRSSPAETIPNTPAALSDTGPHGLWAEFLLSESSRLHQLRQLTVLLVCLAGLVSVGIGVRHCIATSHDLQWQGARLLGRHIDPWAEALAGYPHHDAEFSPPNYLHHLYVLLLPLGLLPFRTAAAVWCVVNIGLSVLVVGLLRRIFTLGGFPTALLLGLFWMSTPLRVTLQLGQLSLLELACFCLVYAAASQWTGGLAFGVSLAKYSFSPTAGVYYLLRRRLLLLAVALLVPAVGILVVSAIVGTPLRMLALEPFRVSRTSVSPGLSDLMTLAEYGLRPHLALRLAQLLAYGTALAGGTVYAVFMSRHRLTRQGEFTLIAISSLFFLKHLVYDYVFLAVLLAYALSPAILEARRRLLLGVGVFWFVASLLDRSSHGLVDAVVLSRQVANTVMLGTLLALASYAAIVEGRAVQDVSDRSESERVEEAA